MTPTHKTAFSLIEVNIAILIVAVGLFSLITLFPSGLRLSVTALSDTRQALFASHLLNTIHANAVTADLTLDQWLNFDTFWDSTSFNRPNVSKPTEISPNIYYAEGTLEPYLDNRRSPLRYSIRIARYSSSDPDNYQPLTPTDPIPRNVSGNFHLDPLTWRISVAATDSLLGSPTNGTVFHLEVRYQPTVNILSTRHPLSIAF